LRPSNIARIAGILCNDAAGNNARSWLEVRRQASCDAEAQDTVAALPNCGFKGTPELYPSTATDNGYPRTGHDASLESKARYGHETRPVHTTQ
jgi:hypothetical protein